MIRADVHPKLSIIIVSFNTRDVLRKCLDALRAAELEPSYEVIVVDNGSKDGTPELVAREYAEVRLICNGHNVRFSKANNQAFSQARGEYLLLLNSDAFIQRGTLECLVAFLDAHPKAAIAGPRIVNADGTLQSQGNPPPTLWTMTASVLQLQKLPLPACARRLLLPGFPGKGAQPAPAGWVSGCCLLLRSAIVREIGGLCEALWFYGEEVEFCFRAIRAGHEVWYVPAVSTVHLGGASMAQADTKEFDSPWKRLANFTVLARATVGYRHAILVCVVALVATHLKYLVARLTGHGYSARLGRSVAWQTLVLRHLIRVSRKARRGQTPGRRMPVPCTGRTPRNKRFV